MLQHDSQIAGSYGADAQRQMPHLGTLDEFALEWGCENGVTLNELEPGTRIIVATKHSCYRLQLIDGARGNATVVGGSLFREPTEVRVEGATAGGSVIKCGWIGVGLRMELTIGMRTITTSRVTAFAVERPFAAAPAA